MTKTDLIIIGAGPGGYRTAELAARRGMQVIVFEAAEAGGTCLNCGCIPTKTLCHDAESPLLVDGSYDDNARLFSQAVARKQQVVETLRQGVETLMQQPGITFVKSKATFTDSHTVIADGEEYTADNIIIATGSRSKTPPIQGIDSPCVVSSTELLETDTLPHSLCIVGAGVIGMEFASIFNAFGTKVTVVEFLKECLPAIDSDIAKRLRKQLEKRGVEFFMQAAVKSIDAGKVCFERKGKESAVEADTILIATGRAANVEGLQLEKAGIDYGRQGIVVDDNMQTNVPHIYAIGDVNGRQMLAHAATFQGIRALNAIQGKTDNIRLDIMPAAVFTQPEVASVGLTEDICKEQVADYTCHKGYYRSNGKALAVDAADGIVKILTDNAGKIIGAHVMGAHAADIVQELSALMNVDITLSRLADMVHIHPTLSEIVQDIAIAAS